MERDRAIIYLLALSELDRRAYRLLLMHEFDQTVDLESDFSAVSVWSAMRSKPRLALVVIDCITSVIRDSLEMIPRLCSETRILAISAAVDQHNVREWRNCELAGYCVKDGGLQELREALETVLGGGTYFSPGILEALENNRKAESGFDALSQRESELLPLLAKGMSLREAASIMTVSYKTADSYRTSLLRKLGVRDRVGLARWAIRAKIVEP